MLPSDGILEVCIYWHADTSSEITVGYGSSAFLSGDMLLDFFDADEANEHLELMRLRSQAYSSLYGYAGTAINPQSHICLLNFDLGESLTSQHLDKMAEFCDSLTAWESELSPSLRVGQEWNGAMVNLNRVNANMYLIYYQVRNSAVENAGIFD